MILRVFDDKVALGRAAATQAAEAIRNTIKTRGQARIIAATGASQFEFLDALTAMPGIEWTRSEEHTSELQSQSNLVCRLLLEKKKIAAGRQHIAWSARREDALATPYQNMDAASPTVL